MSVTLMLAELILQRLPPAMRRGLALDARRHGGVVVCSWLRGTLRFGVGTEDDCELPSSLQTRSRRMRRRAAGCKHTMPVLTHVMDGLPPGTLQEIVAERAAGVEHFKWT